MRQNKIYKLEELQFSFFFRKKKRLERIFKTKMCKNRKDDGKCYYSEDYERKRCRFAHSQNELKIRNKYNSDSKYKEQQCFKNNCRLNNCKYYHSIDEKRQTILENNLLHLKKSIQNDKIVLLKQQQQSLNERKLNKKLNQTNKRNEIIYRNERLGRGFRRVSRFGGYRGQQTESRVQEIESTKKEQNQLILPTLVQRKLNFSYLIPRLTTFERDQQSYLSLQILEAIKFLNNETNKTQETKQLKNNEINKKNQNQQELSKVKNGNNSMKQNYINGVILNLTQTNSLLRGDQKYFIVQFLSSIPILKFKHYYFTYERNQLKGQVSYVANSHGLVSFICQDMMNQKPKSLKLEIKSLNKDFDGFKQIMKTIADCKQSLCKVDLCVKEFIGPKNIVDLEKIFQDSLFPLDNLKALNLKIQFDYLEDGEYEKNIVDIMTDMIVEITKKIPQLKFQLNIFGIVIKLSGFSQEIYYEDTQRDTQKIRNKTNSMFKNSNLHHYLLSQFSEKFRPRRIKFLTIDFSNMYLTQKRKEDNTAPHHKYDNEIEKIIEGTQSIIRGIHDDYIEKLRMKFFGFQFQFEILNNLKRNYFRFHMNFQLLFQNSPVVTLRKFKPFYELLQKKLRYKYTYSTYEGDLFTSKYYPKKKKYNNNNNNRIDRIEISPRKKFILLTINNASQFIDCMVKDWKNIMTIKYYSNDIYHLQKILKIRNTLTHTISLEIDNPYALSARVSKIYSANKYIDLYRRKFLYIYAKMKKIYQRNKTFFFRKEILSYIFDLIRLRVSDCSFY